ncbi:peptidoglycan recognition protein [Streptomyces sp. NPDC005017]|uniref:peptidoglycan recognition protein family protein n=1 Tax=Streptomyces sp. NPDC005017 TaxID=3364706 RepID=UPI00368EC8C5
MRHAARAVMVLALGTLTLQSALAASAHSLRNPGTPAPNGARAQVRTVELAPGRATVTHATTAAPFRMLGVTWDDPSAPLTGVAEVRTRASGSLAWSEWKRLDSGDSHGDDSARRGGTDPLWVGTADEAEVRIVTDGEELSDLPEGLRLDLVDPGPGTAAGPLPTVPPPAAGPNAPGAAGAPRPVIVSRAGWGADESLSSQAASYAASGKIKAAVVHHTADSNSYTCADAAAVIRAIHAYHVNQLGWRDIGYNFLVDRCGTVYEGRKGGVDRAVVGAHAYGFNTQTTGIAVLGTFTTAAPPQAVLNSLGALAAWKLGQYGIDPAGTTTLTAGADGTDYFHGSWLLGAPLTMPTLHGHRDGYNTECPGEKLYAELPAIRAIAAGRTPAKP